ncbi:hypothetical protein CGMCC3_g2148 [Colletotrichum fructicola]|nr:uncharacterized protein CGMCC3_g2148 [Colletotrichum fructicola]KAE9581605.1 hypothetical protein CGMCC3_g2148 [Colletotrichum fructicola]
MGAGCGRDVGLQDREAGCGYGHPVRGALHIEGRRLADRSKAGPVVGIDSGVLGRASGKALRHEAPWIGQDGTHREGIWVVCLMRNGLTAWRERRLKYVAKTSFCVADLVRPSL